jgi:hypothetical protein
LAWGRCGGETPAEGVAEKKNGRSPFFFGARGRLPPLKDFDFDFNLLTLTLTFYFFKKKLAHPPTIKYFYIN